MAMHYGGLMSLPFLPTQRPISSEVPNPANLRREILTQHHADLAAALDFDPSSTAFASTDFGRLTVAPPPAAVLRPRVPADIASLVRTSVRLNTVEAVTGAPAPFTIAARGRGHSVWGQAAAPGGVVIDMPALGSKESTVGPSRIRVVLPTTTMGDWNGEEGGYVDAGGEQLWSDVLRVSLKHDVAPRVWTDYLDLTVGGTLSAAGISGQAFRHGPQISNVIELDVITGKGDFVTCSEQRSRDLFHAVLGGLGQFGVITRARIAIEAAPQRVKWLRMFYTSFDAFANDLERLIKQAGDATTRQDGGSGFDYVEGLVYHNWSHSPSSTTSIRAHSFFSNDDRTRVAELYATAAEGILYATEACLYYSDDSTVDLAVSSLLKGLSYAPGLVFSKDVTYTSFLHRVNTDEARLRAEGRWDVPHPWLTLFVPKTSIADFDAKIFKSNLAANMNGAVLVYPLNRSKWDDRMSAVVPDEPVFYIVNLLKAAMNNETAEQLEHNTQILEACQAAGIKYKLYMPHYTTESDWAEHFGSKWEMFVERKRKYDPMAILAPGQGIFTTTPTLFE